MASGYANAPHPSVPLSEKKNSWKRDKKDGVIRPNKFRCSMQRKNKSQNMKEKDSEVPEESSYEPNGGRGYTK
jgi:hypothetical protein